VVIKTERSDKTEIRKILFKNQRPPTEVVWAPSKGHPHTPTVLLVVADSLLEDIAIFQHVKDAGDILGIKLLAHIVLSTGGTVRFL
jgi:hypothetical protein